MKNDKIQNNITIKDVARHAGVSVATVSRTINNKSNVLSTTKQKIYKSIEELGYIPNSVGKSLRNASTKLLLSLIPSISNPFYAQIVAGMEDYARKNGYNILLCETNSDISQELEMIQLVKSQMADGMVWIDPMLNTQYIERLASEYAITICAQSRLDKVSSVSIDNISATEDIVNFLFERGKKSIAFFGSDENHFYNNLRAETFEKCSHSLGISNCSKCFYPGFNKAKIIEGFKQCLEDKHPCDAIITISDVQSLHILELANEMDVSIGDELYVVGFDNLDFGRATKPTLTSVDQPKYEIGYQAARILINHINNEHAKVENLILPHRLILRDSAR